MPFYFAMVGYAILVLNMIAHMIDMPTTSKLNFCLLSKRGRMKTPSLSVALPLAILMNQHNNTGCFERNAKAQLEYIVFLTNLVFPGI